MRASLYLRLYRQLSGQMRRRQSGFPEGVPFGLQACQWVALTSLTWRPGHTLEMAFGDTCPLPRWLVLSDGARVPIRALRSERGCLHGWFQAQNDTNPLLQGTLTGLLRQRQSNRLYALTAGHVLSASAATAPGDRVILQDAATGRGVNAQLEHWTPSLYAGRVESAVDAGLARIGIEPAQDLIDYGLSMPTGIVDANINDSLWLLARDMEIPLEVRSYTTALLGIGGSGSEITLVDGLAYQAASAPVAGDSGAPIWDGQDRIAAMHVGGALSDGAGNGVAIRIYDVLRWCDCAMIDRNATLLRNPAPLQPAPTPAPTAVPPPQPLEIQPLSSHAVTLALTLWGEARGEGSAGMAAVACVVLNRVRRQTYWGKNVTEVCRKPYQFSCWNVNDRNRAALLRLNAESPDLSGALTIARSAIDNQLPDSTAGATHYHNRTVTPRWARGHAPCAVIGNHLFYNDIQ